MPNKASTAILRHIRRLSTTGPTTRSGAISISKVKSQLRGEFDPDKALEIYSSLSKDYSSPATPRYALELTVRRLVKSRRTSDIINLLESQKSDPNVIQEPFLATLVRSYGIAYMFDRALQLFHDMDNLGTPRTSLSFNALLSAAINCRLFRKVPHLFDEITSQYSVVPDQISYGILAKSFCEVGEPERALQILNEKGVEITTVSYTTILDALYRKGKIEEGERLWKEMKEKGCVDVTAFNVKIKFATSGVPEKMKEMMDEMVGDGFVPDTISYNYLMAFYFKAGRVEEAKKVFVGLREKGCRPNSASFRTLVFYLCRNEDFEGGYEIFKESVKVHKIPDFTTMKILVEGLAKKGKKEEARELIGTVKKRFSRNVLKAWAKVEENLKLGSDDGDHSGEVQGASAL